MRPARLLRILIAAAVAAGLLYYLRKPGGPASSDPDSASAQRGGQIVGTIRSEPRSFNRLLARDQTSDVVS